MTAFLSKAVPFLTVPQDRAVVIDPRDAKWAAPTVMAETSVRRCLSLTFYRSFAAVS